MDFPPARHGFFDPQQRLLRGIPAFATLPDSARQELAAHLAEQSFPKHALILDEGEPADRLFLIEEGEVEVSIATPEGRAPLRRLSEGEMFGEIGLLLPSRRRTARVTATTALLTSTLRGRHLTEVMERYPEARHVLEEAADHALVRSFVKCTRPFERLTPERLRHFGGCLQPLSFEAGATIFKQGDPGDVCYLLRSGVVEVIRNEPAGPRKVARLEAGDIVGESALLTSTPRDASLVVAERAELLALRRDDLIQVLDEDKRIAAHIVELMRQRERPLAKAGIVLQPRPTATGETIWVLADPSRLGAYHQVSSLGLYVWNHLDGANNVEEVAARYPTERGPAAPVEIARIMAELVQAGFATVRQLDPEAAAAVGPRQPWWKRVWRGLRPG
jgi:CRP-like cAMP-binding protein